MGSRNSRKYFYKNYKPSLGNFEKIYGTFKFENYIKMAKGQEPQAEDPCLPKFPENVYEYMKYLLNYLTKTSTSWGKTRDLLAELDLNLKKTTNVLQRLSDNMVELYNQNQKLNLMIVSKDEEITEIFKISRKFFGDWGRLNRQERGNPERSNSQVSPHLHGKSLNGVYKVG